MAKEQDEEDMHEPEIGDTQKEAEESDLPVSNFLMNLILGKESNDPNRNSESEAEKKQEETMKKKARYHFLQKIRLEIINKCFSKRTVKEIISALEQEAPNAADGWVTAAIQSLRKASPTSLKISLRSIREGRLQTVGECLRREYRMVSHVMHGDFSKDFFEGCRAILLDKDGNPKWMPPSLEQVHDEVVEKYFSKVDDPLWEDLNLPARRSHGRRLVPKL